MSAVLSLSDCELRASGAVAATSLAAGTPVAAGVICVEGAREGGATAAGILEGPSAKAVESRIVETRELMLSTMRALISIFYTLERPGEKCQDTNAAERRKPRRCDSP